MSQENSLYVAKNYFDILCQSDISRIDGVKRDSNLTRAILRAYARCVSTIDSDKTMYDDIRSKTAIRTSPKKSFVDPSLAVMALGCSKKELMLDINTFGLLFENLVDRDLSIYAKKNGGVLTHYRDNMD